MAFQASIVPSDMDNSICPSSTGAARRASTSGARRGNVRGCVGDCIGVGSCVAARERASFYWAHLLFVSAMCCSFRPEPAEREQGRERSKPAPFALAIRDPGRPRAEAVGPLAAVASSRTWRFAAGDSGSWFEARRFEE
jgi:hypothetical protein